MLRGHTGAKSCVAVEDLLEEAIQIAFAHGSKIFSLGAYALSIEPRGKVDCAILEHLKDTDDCCMSG